MQSIEALDLQSAIKQIDSIDWREGCYNYCDQLTKQFLLHERQVSLQPID